MPDSILHHSHEGSDRPHTHVGWEAHSGGPHGQPAERTVYDDDVPIARWRSGESYERTYRLAEKLSHEKVALREVLSKIAYDGKPENGPADWGGDEVGWVCQAHGEAECSQTPACIAALALRSLP